MQTMSDMPGCAFIKDTNLQKYLRSHQSVLTADPGTMHGMEPLQMILLGNAAACSAVAPPVCTLSKYAAAGNGASVHSTQQ